MSRLLKAFAFVLAALWLPATQHCALEAVGALITTCADHCAPGESSGKDGCSSIENGNFKPSGITLKAPAPNLFACACFLCLRLELRAPDASRSLIGDASGQADTWLSAWQFVRRAAPLPGAPSQLLA